MWNNTKNNRTNGVNVNTTLYTSYSDESLLKLIAWNKRISLRVQPSKGTNADGVRQYADQNAPESVFTTLMPDNCEALLAGIKDTIVPAIKASTDASVSVMISSGDNRKILTITRSGSDTYLIISTHVDEVGKCADQNVLTHKFNKRSYFTNYSPKTGVTNEVICDADFATFVSTLYSVRDMSGAIAHSIKYDNDNRQSYASSKTGATQYANNNGWGNDNNNYQAPVQNMSTDDLDSLFN